MEMKSRMGSNKTGLKSAPAEIPPAGALAPASNPDGQKIAELRADYAEEAESVGTIPLPSNLKGAAAAAFEKLKGSRPEILIDKLGERLAFERTGTRLYDALLAKLDAAPEALPEGARDELARFRAQEAEHFNLVADALETIGADSTAQTPCADVTGVASQGLLQAVSDPRTTIPQCLSVLLTAELTDNAGWELLIELAREHGQEEMEADFARAFQQEGLHLLRIREWVKADLIEGA
jgi:hypothetical protein